MNFETAKQHLTNDRVLKEVIASTTVNENMVIGNVYFNLLDSIVSQQLSVKVANVIFGRFTNLFPDKIPHPDLIIQTPIETLRSVGLSNQKASYLQNVAHFALQNDLENKDWNSMTNEEIIHFLTAIKGVGKWTVEMILMFTLLRPDVFPIDDLGIQQGMAKLYNLEETGKALQKRMLEIAEPWSPHRTVASLYIWRWKDTNK